MHLPAFPLALVTVRPPSAKRCSANAKGAYGGFATCGGSNSFASFATISTISTRGCSSQCPGFAAFGGTTL